MILYTALKWATALCVILSADLFADSMTWESPSRLLAVSFILTVAGVWLDRRLLPDHSSTTAALVDLFAFSLLLYTLQYLFPPAFVDSGTALTVGLILAVTEAALHRIYPFFASRSPFV
ncbi:hypothetical protein C8P63_105124 [Melghirimyces profundicolus]|uniref:DUF2512 family protein n=1 Tax=Melghirimyces profundicolus TaxID=1242148 RepID=A0A2T6C2I5_9BACL|nr:hypothetical protein [Melghirimyces profundicolus]PTX62529.1 hypothetical protein C8P63_105124 [Melghirimyces profundicolus]